MKRLIPWLAGFFLLNAEDGLLFIDRLLYGEWDGKTGDTVTRCLNLLFILSAMPLFLYGNFVSRQKLPLAGTMLVAAFVGLLMLSGAWSLVPAKTVQIAIEYVFVLCGIIGLVRSLRAEQFMAILTWVCLLCAVMSIILRIVSPGSALLVGVAGTDFRGIFPHKNVLGEVMATGALCCLHGLRAEQGARIRKCLMLVLFTGMAFASHSTGALMVTLIFIGISVYLSLRNKGGSFRLVGNIGAIAVTPALLLVLFAPDTLLVMIGKDPTLTGRTEIWGFVCSYIGMKPMLGWGYFGFWFAGNPAAVAISDAVHWVVPQAHNGLLELLLNVGFLGTGFVLFLVARNIVLGIRCLNGPRRDLGISAIMCCVGLLMEGISEAVLLSPTAPMTNVFFALGLFCEQALRNKEAVLPLPRWPTASRNPDWLAATPPCQDARVARLPARVCVSEIAFLDGDDVAGFHLAYLVHATFDRAMRRHAHDRRVALDRARRKAAGKGHRVQECHARLIRIRSRVLDFAKHEYGAILHHLDNDAWISQKIFRLQRVRDRLAQRAGGQSFRGDRPPPVEVRQSRYRRF